MCSYITFGNYNKLYKYIWFYIIIRIIGDFLLDNKFYKAIIGYEPFPKNILVQETLNYIGITIFSTILWKYRFRQNIISKSYNTVLISENTKSSSITFIYHENKQNLKEVSCIFFLLLFYYYFYQAN